MKNEKIKLGLIKLFQKVLDNKTDDVLPLLNSVASVKDVLDWSARTVGYKDVDEYVKEHGKDGLVAMLEYKLKGE